MASRNRSNESRHTRRNKLRRNKLRRAEFKARNVQDEKLNALNNCFRCDRLKKLGNNHERYQMMQNIKTPIKSTRPDIKWLQVSMAYVNQKYGIDPSNPEHFLLLLREVLFETRKRGKQLSFQSAQQVDNRLIGGSGSMWWSHYNFATAGEIFTNSNGERYRIGKTYGFTCDVERI